MTTVRIDPLKNPAFEKVGVQKDPAIVARLQELQDVLESRGVKDIKFFFDPGETGKKTFNEVAAEVIEVLEAYVEGRCKPAERLNDSIMTPGFSHVPATVSELRSLLQESSELFRFYENSHRQRGPEHLEKANRNAEIAGRIEALLTRGN